MRSYPTFVDFAQQINGVIGRLAADRLAKASGLLGVLLQRFADAFSLPRSTARGKYLYFSRKVRGIK
jgi:hypothetical protein